MFFSNLESSVMVEWAKYPRWPYPSDLGVGGVLPVQRIHSFVTSPPVGSRPCTQEISRYAFLTTGGGLTALFELPVRYDPAGMG
jgi:hypothetical protein